MRKVILIALTLFTIVNFAVHADSSTYGSPTMDTTGSAHTGTDNGASAGSGSGFDTTPYENTGTEDSTNSDLDITDDPTPTFTH